MSLCRALAMFLIAIALFSINTVSRIEAAAGQSAEAKIALVGTIVQVKNRSLVLRRTAGVNVEVQEFPSTDYTRIWPSSPKSLAVGQLILVDCNSDTSKSKILDAKLITIISPNLGYEMMPQTELRTQCLGTITQLAAPMRIKNSDGRVYTVATSHLQFVHTKIIARDSDLRPQQKVSIVGIKKATVLEALTITILSDHPNGNGKK